MGKIAYLVLWALGLSLMGFTAMRTVHFLSLTFPPDQQAMPYLGLAAFDGGALGWFLFGKFEARGWQRAISYCMVAFCLIGVCICTYADTFLVSSQNGLVKLPGGLADKAIVGVVVIILVNVVAVFGAHLVSPESIRQWKIESAKDKIEEQTIKQIEQQAQLIAPDIAEKQGKIWVSETYQNLQLTPKKKAIEVASDPIEP